MNATIEMDKAGRVVLPKKMRDALHVGDGARFEVEEKDDGLFLRPLYPELRLIRKSGVLVMAGGPPVSYDLGDGINADREDRLRYLSGESTEP